MDRFRIRFSKRRFLSIWENAGIVVIFLLMFVTLSFSVDRFFSLDNILSLAISVSMVGMVACTMLFCLAAGEFDLSVETVVALSGVLAAAVINKTGSAVLGISAGIFAGGLVGVINGVVVSKFKINALITTLATMQIVKGFAFIISGGFSAGITIHTFFMLGSGSFLGVQNPIWITALCMVIFGFLLNFTVYGRNTLAIGGNKEAARLAGIKVDEIKIAIFTIQGVMAGFAGVVLASRMQSGQPNTSSGFALDVISACVLGGVSLSGGVGSITGILVGVLIMGTMQNAMALMNIDTFYQYIARGTILLAAVLFDQFKQKKKD
jgi:L-arabinose transport system permease protein